MTTMAAGQFKAKCLDLMDQVEATGEEILITKHGRPVAKLVPISIRKDKGPFFGKMKGTLQYEEDNPFETYEETWLDEKTEPNKKNPKRKSTPIKSRKK